MDLSKIKIFYDGCNIRKYYNNPHVVGFTMNSTYIRDSKFPSYREFYDEYAENINHRPISLQITSDDNIEDQAISLASFDENVYVKIPVINSQNESNIEVIRRLLEKNIKVNITCVFTKIHIDSIYAELNRQTTPFIVSVFAGSIADTGVEPYDTVKHAVDTFAPMSNVEILWAGVKEIMSIKYAIDYKCHIITVPDAVFDRFSRVGLNLEEMACNKVKSFNKEAENIRII
jgi:transaldolase